MGGSTYNPLPFSISAFFFPTRPGVDKEEPRQGDEFQVVDVADGKIKTKQLNQTHKLKDAKNVDEFGTTSRDIVICACVPCACVPCACVPCA